MCLVAVNQLWVESFWCRKVWFFPPPKTKHPHLRTWCENLSQEIHGFPARMSPKLVASSFVTIRVLRFIKGAFSDTGVIFRDNGGLINPFSSSSGVVLDPKWWAVVPFNYGHFCWVSDVRFPGCTQLELRGTPANEWSRIFAHVMSSVTFQH